MVARSPGGKSHLTYANVVSTLCLFILLGGSAVAAVKLSRNSVRSTHIKNGQVKKADLGRNAVDSSKVKDGSLLSQDFAAGQLAPGPKGDKGETGDRGPQGGAGPGAVKLVLTRPATGGSTLEPFAAVGPFEFASICSLVGGDEIVASVRVRGGTAAEYEMAAVEASNDAGPTLRTRRPGQPRGRGLYRSLEPRRGCCRQFPPVRPDDPAEIRGDGLERHPERARGRPRGLAELPRFGKRRPRELSPSVFRQRMADNALERRRARRDHRVKQSRRHR